MSSIYFDFKQFRVYHQHCAMKVGTDSVLLGAILALRGSEKTVLDIGTGSGLLALMMAQRSAALLDAIEIDEAACGQANENFRQSPWGNRLCATQISLQDFSKSASLPYDLIVSNPPYFEAGKNYSMEDKQRSLARHDGDLSFSDLAKGVAALLKDSGVFWLILPLDESKAFKEIAMDNQLYLDQSIFICPRMGKPVNRVIMSFGKMECVATEKTFTLKDTQGKPTEEYIQTTRQFYLRMGE